jgi:hypothetical protein
LSLTESSKVDTQQLDMHFMQLLSCFSKLVSSFYIKSLFGWLVADGWCWSLLREEYCWLVGGGWFVLREKYCWLVADKPSEQAVGTCKSENFSFFNHHNRVKVLARLYKPITNFQN